MYAILSILVENRPGILFKVTNLFRSKNFNIESISVGVTTNREFSRITVSTTGHEKQIQQIIKQLNKMIDIINVKRLNKNKSVYKEIVLFKIHMKRYSDLVTIKKLVKLHDGKVYCGKKSIIIEVAEAPDKITMFEEKIKQYGILETARTGVVALEIDDK